MFLILNRAQTPSPSPARSSHYARIPVFRATFSLSFCNVEVWRSLRYPRTSPRCNARYCTSFQLATSLLSSDRNGRDQAELSIAVQPATEPTSHVVPDKTHAHSIERERMQCMWDLWCRGLHCYTKSSQFWLYWQLCCSRRIPAPAAARCSKRKWLGFWHC